MAATVIHAFGETSDTLAQGAKTLSQKYFVSPEVFEEEQEKIFAREWVLVGHQTEIPAAGDFVVREVLPSSRHYGATGAGESIIIIRDKGSDVRAYYNVCRHRGTRLCEEASGHAAAIQCPYHAWTYGLDGRLIGAPHMDEVRGFDRNDYSLHRVEIGVWEGFIFVNLAAEAMPLENWLAPLRGKFSHWNLPKLRSAKRVEYDVRANWKLMFENYAECYHCPGVHPQLQKVSPYDSAENDLREGPFLGGFMKINAGKSLTMSGNACAAFVGKIENLQQVFYYSIFPNMLLSLHPEYVMVHQLWPQSLERTLIICDWLFHPDAFEVQGGQPEFNPEDAIEFWDVTNKQDWHVCELSQQGIASRVYKPGPYSTRELIPAAWDREYLRQMQ
jgi:Rieske 2Fe-2S family protein